MGSLSEAAALAELLRAQLVDRGGPVFVGFDGRSGVGKSTLAAAVAALLAERPAPVGALVIEGDSFYTGGTAARWDRRTAEEKAEQVIDWRRQRAVLEGLRRWGVADWHPFDWEAEDWDQDPPPHADVPISVEVAPVVILEGAYSCRPELHDLLDLRAVRAFGCGRDVEVHEPGVGCRGSACGTKRGCVRSGVVGTSKCTSLGRGAGDRGA